MRKHFEFPRSSRTSTARVTVFSEMGQIPRIIIYVQPQKADEVTNTHSTARAVGKHPRLARAASYARVAHFFHFES
jgi:hypothetical protein